MAPSVAATASRGRARETRVRAVEPQQALPAGGVRQPHLDRLVDPSRALRERPLQHLDPVRGQDKTTSTSSPRPSSWLRISKSRGLEPGGRWEGFVAPGANPLLFEILNPLGLGDDVDVVFVLRQDRVGSAGRRARGAPGRVDEAVEWARTRPAGSACSASTPRPGSGGSISRRVAATDGATGHLPARARPALGGARGAGASRHRPGRRAAGGLDAAPPTCARAAAR